MKTNPNDPAFTTLKTDKDNPIVNEHGSLLPEIAGGLTKREYFAAMAMTGLLANRNRVTDIAEDATDMADDLIRELNKE